MAEGVVMTITKLQRTGTGEFVDSGVSFRWDGPTHSSAQGTIEPKLGMKIVRKEIPGSNDVVHQAMSATWQPFEMKGEWRDVWMGSGEAWRTFVAFSQMAQEMPLVRVTLDELSFVGMLQDFTPGYVNKAWITWSFTLSPETNESVQKPVQKATLKPKQSAIPQWVKDVTDQTDVLGTTLDDADVMSLKTEDLQDVVDAKSELDDAVGSLSGLLDNAGLGADLVSAINSVGSDVTELVWKLPTAFERVRRSAIDVFVAVKDQRADLSLAFDDLLECLRFSQYVHDTVSSCWGVVATSRDAAVDMRSRTSTFPKAIYRPKPGESLERISKKFYGTPDNADVIYRANGLHSIVLTGSEELIIPDVGA